jgi:putative DNA base modification enzyme with NMAD domain/EVE domain-containing protein
MKGLLIRVGIDSSYGQWNAPVDPETGGFLYVPIPEDEGAKFREGLERQYNNELKQEIEAFYSNYSPNFPKKLYDRSMHFDPDFKNLTYGDNGQRANPIREMKEDDLIAFYVGFRSINSADKKLVYAIIGLYIIDEVVEATEVKKNRWNENAHTRRRVKPEDDDVVVRAKITSLGRLEKCIHIGEWRENAYRVKKDILEEWGGLSVKNGYIQRGATLPQFKKPDQFYTWFKNKNIELMKKNNLS